MDGIKTVEYTERMGKMTLPEGAEEVLRGLSVEEQLKHFVGQVRSIGAPYECPLGESAYVDAVILGDGLIVGVMLSDVEGAPFTAIGESRFIGSEDADNNGAGYKTIDYYFTALFVPADE